VPPGVVTVISQVPTQPAGHVPATEQPDGQQTAKTIFAGRIMAQINPIPPTKFIIFPFKFIMGKVPGPYVSKKCTTYSYLQLIDIIQYIKLK
jgi:hypothetical protein